MTPSSLVTILALVLASGSVRAAPVETNTFWVDSSVWTPVGAEANGTEAVQALIERRLPVEYAPLYLTPHALAQFRFWQVPAHFRPQYPTRHGQLFML